MDQDIEANLSSTKRCECGVFSRWNVCLMVFIILFCLAFLIFGIVMGIRTS